MTASAFPMTNASPQDLVTRGQGDPNASAGPIIGGIFGAAIGIFILALVCICCLKGTNECTCWSRRRRPTRRSTIRRPIVNIVPDPSRSSNRDSSSRTANLQVNSQPPNHRHSSRTANPQVNSQSSNRTISARTRPRRPSPVHHGRRSRTSTPHQPARQVPPPPPRDPSSQRSHTNSAPPPQHPPPQGTRTNSVPPPSNPTHSNTRQTSPPPNVNQRIDRIQAMLDRERIRIDRDNDWEQFA